MQLAFLFLLVGYTSTGDARRIPTPATRLSTAHESPLKSIASRNRRGGMERSARLHDDNAPFPLSTLAKLFFSHTPALPNSLKVASRVADPKLAELKFPDETRVRPNFAGHSKRVKTLPIQLFGSEITRMKQWWKAINTTKMNVMIAGGGIGGLFAGLVLQNDGHDVSIYEKTIEYRPFGGPIQIATNALESIKRIDSDVHKEILEKSTVIGDRINGLKDGVSNEWFGTFDLLTPAKEVNGEPSVVIDRPVLQDILLSKVGKSVTKGIEVEGYEQLADGTGVIGHLANGTKVKADLLIGSDGIHSKVRQHFYTDPTDAVWSGYTCFAGIANIVPDDIKEVGYKIFLGHRKYFVSVDVGGGRIQWYAFLNIPPRTAKVTGDTREWLKTTQFEGWTQDVQDLIDSTEENQIEQRDLYDRRPELTLAEGNVLLLGDAAHPMMPNLGQGGGIAIEDALVLGQEIRALKYRGGSLTGLVPFALKEYSEKRAMRAAAVQGLSRISSAFLFQYEPPLTVHSVFPLNVTNVGVRSAITRACQGFLQHVIFPLQFQFLFGFPGNAIKPLVYEEDYAGETVENDFLLHMVGKVDGKDFFKRYMSITN